VCEHGSYVRFLVISPKQTTFASLFSRGDNEWLERPSIYPQFQPFKKGIKEKLDKRKLKRNSLFVTLSI
jgi:hypothetical protein